MRPGLFLLVCCSPIWLSNPCLADSTRRESAADGSPRLSDGTELEQVVERYMAGDYERCMSELSGFLDPKGLSPFRDAGVIERARLYFASCALLAGHQEPAHQALRAALEANPLMSAPDSLTFPPPVVSLFLEVRDEVEQLIARREAEKLTELKRQADEAGAREQKRKDQERLLRRLAAESVVTATSSRVVASLPFGAGQFQSGQNVLGTVFLVSEVLLTGALVTSGVVHGQLRERAVSPDRSSSLNGPLEATQQLALVSTVLLAGVVAAGITEAHLTFQKERVLEVRRRPLPAELALGAKAEDPALRLKPGLSLGPTGGQLTVFGTF